MTGFALILVAGYIMGEVCLFEELKLGGVRKI